MIRLMIFAIRMSYCMVQKSHSTAAAQQYVRTRVQSRRNRNAMRMLNFPEIQDLKEQAFFLTRNKQATRTATSLPKHRQRPIPTNRMEESAGTMTESSNKRSKAWTEEEVKHYLFFAHRPHLLLLNLSLTHSRSLFLSLSRLHFSLSIRRMPGWWFSSRRKAPSTGPQLPPN